MSKAITAEIIQPIKEKLENHPIYQAVSTLEDLKSFMEHHVYSVWDFMSMTRVVNSGVRTFRTTFHEKLGSAFATYSSNAARNASASKISCAGQIRSSGVFKVFF